MEQAEITEAQKMALRADAEKSHYEERKAEVAALLRATLDAGSTGLWTIGEYTNLDKRIPILNASGHTIAWVDNDDTQDGPGNANLIVKGYHALVGLCEELERKS